jgi:hypothetical protein
MFKDENETEERDKENEENKIIENNAIGIGLDKIQR